MSGKIVFDVVKKAFPGASKAVKNTFKKLYDEMSVNMSKDSAFEQAKRETREIHKDMYKKKPEGKKIGGMLKAYTGKAVKQSTETKKEFEMRHEHHTSYKGLSDYYKGLI